jgi:hypothetical protein
MCGCERFHETALGPYVLLQLSYFNVVRLRGSVCLSCGFVAPCVDERGLEKVRQLAGITGNERHNKPDAEEAREL